MDSRNVCRQEKGGEKQGKTGRSHGFPDGRAGIGKGRLCPEWRGLYGAVGRTLAGEIRQSIRGRFGPVLRAGLLDGQEQGTDGQAVPAVEAVPGKMGQCSPCGRRDLRRGNAGAGHCPHGECLYAGRRSGHFRGQRPLYAGARRECLRADQFCGASAGNAGGRGRNADDLRPRDHVWRNLPAFLHDVGFRVSAEI